MEHKQQYREPDMEIVRFHDESIILTSGTKWPDDWSGALDQLNF